MVSNMVKYKIKKQSLAGRLFSFAMAAMLLLAMMLLLSSCGEREQPYVPGSHEIGTTGISVYPELVKVDLEYGSKDLGFPLNFVSKKSLPEDKIKIVRLEGKNADYFETPIMTRRQLEDVTDVEINGKYLYSYQIDLDIDVDHFTPYITPGQDLPPEMPERPDIWDICIDTIVVEIDGEEYPIKLVNPVKYQYHCKFGGYNDISGNSMFGPIMVFTFALTNRYSASIQNSASDILVKDFYFSDFLDITSKSLHYKGEYIGELTGDKLYPIAKRTSDEVSGGDGGVVYFNAAFSENYKSTEFDYILCTSVIEYQVEGDDTVYKMKFPFNSQGFANRDNVEKFLAYVDTLD